MWQKMINPICSILIWDSDKKQGTAKSRNSTHLAKTLQFRAVTPLIAQLLRKRFGCKCQWPWCRQEVLKGPSRGRHGQLTGHFFNRKHVKIRMIVLKFWGKNTSFCHRREWLHRKILHDYIYILYHLRENGIMGSTYNSLLNCNQ